MLGFFFSIVAHRDRPGSVLVRARVRADLMALVRLLPMPRPKVPRTPHADYLFRAVVNKEAMARVPATLTEAIDYDNFKDSVASKQGIDRAKVYHDVWQLLLPLQLQPPKLTLVKSKPKPRRGVSFGMVSGAEVDRIERAKVERLASEARIAAMHPDFVARNTSDGSDISFDDEPPERSIETDAGIDRFPPALVDLFHGDDSDTVSFESETDAGMMPETFASGAEHYAALKKTMDPLTFARLYDQSKGEGIATGSSADEFETFDEWRARVEAAPSGTFEDPPLKPAHERDPALGKKSDGT